MAEANRPPKVKSNLFSGWEANAWVYFVWVVSGNCVYCKIGYSTNPDSRYLQIVGSLPERPYQFDLLPCLNMIQARHFERMLHDNLRQYRTNNEWFSHTNVRHLYKAVQNEVDEIILLFDTFGLNNELSKTDKEGTRPFLTHFGYISHFSD